MPSKVSLKSERSLLPLNRPLPRRAKRQSRPRNEKRYELEKNRFSQVEDCTDFLSTFANLSAALLAVAVDLEFGPSARPRGLVRAAVEPFLRGSLSRSRSRGRSPRWSKRVQGVRNTCSRPGRLAPLGRSDSGLLAGEKTICGAAGFRSCRVGHIIGQHVQERYARTRQKTLDAKSKTGPQQRGPSAVPRALMFGFASEARRR